MMKLAILSLLALSQLGAAENGWTSLFNGKDLTGWKASENSSSFSVKDAPSSPTESAAIAFTLAISANTPSRTSS